MEGVAFSFADGVDVLREAGAAPETPLLVGGGARSGFWGQMIADVTGLDDRPRRRRGGGRGARRGAAGDAGGRSGRGAGDLRATGDATAICSGRRARRAACAATRRYRALYKGERGARG